MRILMTTDSIGGVWHYSLELSRALATRGVGVTLAVLGGLPSDTQRGEAAQLDNVSLHESAFRLEWMPDPWVDLDRAGQWLLSLESSAGADLIHLNHLVHGNLPWSVNAITVGHSCVLSWMSAVRGTSIAQCTDWDVYRTRVTASLRASSHVVAPSRAMLDDLLGLYGPFQHCSVITNARDRRQFRPGRKEPLILAAGRLWDEGKNMSALAAVASRVVCPIVVAGSTRGPRGAAVVLPGLQLLGSLSSTQLSDWYGRASIYALPARYEPFGLTALEAALSGCALVLGDIPSLREIWGPSARYVHPDDHDELREVLNDLLLNDTARNRYAARAMARAREFTPGRQADQYHELYRSLAAGIRRDSVVDKPESIECDS